MSLEWMSAISVWLSFSYKAGNKSYFKIMLNYLLLYYLGMGFWQINCQVNHNSQQWYKACCSFSKFFYGLSAHFALWSFNKSDLTEVELVSLQILIPKIHPVPCSDLKIWMPQLYKSTNEASLSLFKIFKFYLGFDFWK